MRPFTQVDVFTDRLLLGNPVAVVHDADGVSDEQLAAFARWTNLSETTFLLAATDPTADYRLRIFTTRRELAFAGHPTLGSARAWLAAGGRPRVDGELVQQCGTGLVHIRRDGDRLAFAAPPLLRGGPVAPDDVADVARAVGVEPAEGVDAQWADNGPGWVALLLRDAQAGAVVVAQPGGLRALPRHRRHRAVSGRIAGSFRGACNHGRRRRLGRSSDRQPQRGPGPVADPGRLRTGQLRRGAGHSTGPTRAGASES